MWPYCVSRCRAGQLKRVLEHSIRVESSASKWSSRTNFHIFDLAAQRLMHTSSYLQSVKTSSGSMNNNNSLGTSFRLRLHVLRRPILLFCLWIYCRAATATDKMVLFWIAFTENNNSNNFEERKIPFSSLYLCRRQRDKIRNKNNKRKAKEKVRFLNN